jgi:hypothetical protein
MKKKESENKHPNDSNNNNDHEIIKEEKLDTNVKQNKENKQENQKNGNQKQDHGIGAQSKEVKQDNNKQDNIQQADQNENEHESQDSNNQNQGQIISRLNEASINDKKKNFDEISAKGGYIKRHLVNNIGIIHYENEDKYNGGINRANKKEGFGEYIFKNGEKYLGYFKNDEYDKLGKFLFNETNIFTIIENTKPVLGEIIYENPSCENPRYKNPRYFGQINEFFEPNGLGEYREKGLLIFGEFEKGIKKNCIKSKI